jgi:phage gpG-like protein
MQVKITPRNLEAAGVRLGAIGSRLQDLRTILARFGVHAIRSIEQTFEVGGRPQRWRPWAASTAANEAGRLYTKSGRITSSKKRSAGARTGKILVDSARLKNSVVAQLSGPRALSIGSNVVYARIHHLGGTIKIPEITVEKGCAMRWFRAGGAPVFARQTAAHDVTIPPRPWLVLQPEDIELLKQMVSGYVVTGQ